MPVVISGGATGLGEALVREFAAQGSKVGFVDIQHERVEQFRQAAGYVDLVLNGMRAGELPVQMLARFEFVINLRTARALGLQPPEALVARADEVIE
jgi:putative ABC transport system substrate-binding protein